MTHEAKVLVVVPMRPASGELKPFLRDSYREALETVGLSLLPLPATSTYLQMRAAYLKTQGLLLIGGNDINPKLYRQDPLPTTQAPDRNRDQLEQLLTREAYGDNRPVLGICRGAQMLAVAIGGSLNQLIANHETNPPSYANLTEPDAHHEATLLPGSLIYSIFEGNRGNQREVNSMHHQSVERDGLPQYLKVGAYATVDGITEAVEAKDKDFFLGVQWHPEAEFEANKALFAAFAQAILSFH